MNTLNNSELEDILADVEKHAVWYSKNKHNRNPIGHDIGMPKHVALERLEALINKQIIEARIDELKSLSLPYRELRPVEQLNLMSHVKRRLTQLRTTK